MGDTRPLVTVLDHMFEYVQRNGSVRISELAEEFDVGIERVEHYANCIEKCGLLELHYDWTGNLVMKANPSSKRALSPVPAADIPVKAKAPLAKASVHRRRRARVARPALRKAPVQEVMLPEPTPLAYAMQATFDSQFAPKSLGL